MRECATIHLLIIILSRFLFHLWASSPSSSTTSTLCLQHEKNALLNFSSAFTFNSFMPFPEYNGSLWIPGTDCCLWQGVTCHSSTGHVIALNLGNYEDSAGIEGQLPSKLNSSALSRLSSIELYANSVKGTIPTWLFEFPALIKVHLSQNRFTFIGQTNDFPISQLEHFDISFNKIRGPIPSIIFKLKRLKYLDLFFNYLSITIPFTKLLYHFPNVTHLDLSGNYFDLHEVDNTNNTDHLTSSHPQFEHLGLTDCNLTKFPSLLKGQQNILSLYLSRNNIGGDVPTFIFEIKTLEILFLAWNNLTGIIPLSKLQSKIKYLAISGNNMSLRSNNIYGSLLPNTNKKYLFPQLQFLDISINNLNGTFPESFVWSLTGMTPENKIFVPTYFLEMIRDPMSIDGSIRAMIKGIEQHLENKVLSSTVLLHASQNQFQGHIPDAIGSLVALTSLNLSHNCFTGHIPSSLSNLSQLQNLDLSSNRLDGKIPDQLRKLHFLEVFNVSDNNLSSAVPQGNQFNTFDDRSYLGNPRLCGVYLTNKCEKAK